MKRPVSIFPGPVPIPAGTGRGAFALPEGAPAQTPAAIVDATLALHLRAFVALIERTLADGDFGLWAAADLFDALIRAGLARVEGRPDRPQAISLFGVTGPLSTGGAYALLTNWKSAANRRLASL